MSGIFLLLLLACTSAGVYGFGRRWLGLQVPISGGIRRTVETVGVAVVFFVINVGVTIVSVLALRSMGFFASLYVATNYMLIVLSFLQGMVFQYWRYSGTARH